MQHVIDAAPASADGPSGAGPPGRPRCCWSWPGRQASAGRSPWPTRSPCATGSSATTTATPAAPRGPSRNGPTASPIRPRTCSRSWAVWASAGRISSACHWAACWPRWCRRTTPTDASAPLSSAPAPSAPPPTPARTAARSRPGSCRASHPRSWSCGPAPPRSTGRPPRWPAGSHTGGYSPVTDSPSTRTGSARRSDAPSPTPATTARAPRTPAPPSTEVGDRIVERPGAGPAEV